MSVSEPSKPSATKSDGMSSAPHWLLLLLAVFVASVLPFVPTSTLPWSSSSEPSIQYVVLIDGGSSGTRVHVHPYTLPAASSSSSASSPPLPIISPSFSLKVKPGLSAFPTPSDAAQSLLPLLDFATRHVPAHLHATTPIYLYATAGLRTVPLSTAEQILYECRRILATAPFLFLADRVRIISGVQEGMNGWIAANYLSHHFDSSDETPQTVGVLEMGGASFQLTYAPADPSRLPAEMLIPLHIGQHSFQIYTISYLNYGLEKAQELYTKRHNHSHYSDPCYPEGQKGRPANGSLAPVDSRGDYETCVELVDQLILHDIKLENSKQRKAQHEKQLHAAANQQSQQDEWEHPTGQPSSSTPTGDGDDDDTAIHEGGHIVDCTVHSCSFNGRLIPPIAPHEQFLAIENFYYTSEFFSLLNPVADESAAAAAGGGYVAMDLLSMREKGRYYCQLRWEQIDREWPQEPKDDLEKYCFSAAYLPRVLEIGLGMTTNAQRTRVSAQQQSDGSEADVQLTETVTVDGDSADQADESAAHNVLRVDRSIHSERKNGLLHNVRITKHIDGVAIDWALGAVLLEITNHLHKDRYEGTAKQHASHDTL